MPSSTLRDDVSAALVGFAWDQWSQMGVLASGDRRDRWAMDPEALLLFTFEVARDEPRLFDEVLDWLVTNERLVSVQRLRNLAHDEPDRALVDAALGWVAHWRPRPRLTSKRSSAQHDRTAKPLFRGQHTSVAQADPAFLASGLVKATSQPSRKSTAPDLDAPINFAFRLRQLLGVSVRAEVARLLVCSERPRLSVQVIADSAGYAKRNVQEALASLRSAMVIDATTVANEQRYDAPRERWAGLLDLDLDDLPAHRDWPQILRALTQLVRWLTEHDDGDLSDYMLSSEARMLMDEIAPPLRAAGVTLRDTHVRGADYWPAFVTDVREIVRSAL